MAEDADPESKTEDPSPKRREEARKRGQIPYSQEMVGGAILLAGLIGIGSFGDRIGLAMLDAFRSGLSRLVTRDLTSDGAAEVIARTGLATIVATLPLYAVFLAVSIALGIVQVGFQITPEKMEVDFDKLNPAKGVGRLFSTAAVVRGGIALLKVLGLSAVAYWIVEGRFGLVSGANRDRLDAAVGTAWSLVLRLGTYQAGAIAAVGLIDYIYQRRRFETSLRMTKQEVKDEQKQEDGDPQYKVRMRQIARERARRKMLAEVPKAAVVVTNPSHYAVALRYDQGRDAAPVLVAKGAGVLARRIREIAADNRVPVVERPEVARAIYATVKEGQAIPPNLFRAAAEVIAFVLRLRGVSGPAA